MKIAILVSKITGGGAERVAALWAMGFAERGHEVFFILDSTLPQYITYPIPKSVKMYSIGSNIRFNILRSVMNRIRRIIGYRNFKMSRILKTTYPDVVIGVLHPWASQALKATKGMSVKIINTEHNSFERPTCAPMNFKVYQEKFFENRNFDHVTVLTKADLQVIDNRLKNVSVLPNPLPFRVETEIPAKQNVILAAGRLDAWYIKGFDMLIRAWGEICHLYPDWELHIAGTGEKHSYQYLRDLASGKGIAEEQIKFLGFSKDMCPIYKRSSIFVLSSRCEGFGMVLVEAMSQGCACIACDYKGRQSEILTEASQGIICPTEDVEALRKAMIRMITDDDYRILCQHNAIERSKFYSLDRTIDRWEEIFKKLNL